MLENKDKQKIEQYVDKVIDKLRDGTEKDIKSGVQNKVVLNNLVNATVNKLTPESKSILSSVYNMMMEHTLTQDLYQDPRKKAAYYELDILKEINKKFNFEVPSNIDYEENRKLINKWTEAGAIVIIGGVISIPLKSWIPVGIAAIIATLMLILLEDKKNAGKDIYVVIDNYLLNVRKTILDWVMSIECYYDERVAELEREM